MSEASSSSFWTVAEIFCHTLSVNMVLLSTYLLIAQCVKHTDMFVQKRSIYYSLNVSIIVEIIMLTLTSLALLHSSQLALRIVLIADMFTTWLFLYLLMVKKWIIYFKDQWNYAMAEKQWWYIINSTTAATENEQNWYIKHHSTFGNFHYISRLLFFVCFIAAISTAVCFDFILRSNYDLIHIAVTMPVFAITFGAVTGFLAHLFRKIPHTNDSFYIHKETKFYGKILIVFLITSAVNPSFLFFTDNAGHIMLITLEILNICLFSMIYVSAYYLPTLHATEVERQRKNRAPLELSERVTFSMMLSNESALHSFMNFLSKEYSTELMLSYIEFLQFQKYVIDHSIPSYCADGGEHKLLSPDTTTDALDVEPIEVCSGDALPTMADMASAQENSEFDSLAKEITLVDLPANIPTSQIIEAEEQVVFYDDAKQDTFFLNAKIKAHRLYKKYVKIGSEYEINISATERTFLYNTLDNLQVLLAKTSYTERDLVLLFENCKQEMLLLLKVTLARFKGSEKFMAVVDELEIELQ